ncbi:hypothetical protein B0H66DRAFT_594103 [Apodospora peruviana]|uniref:Uncharacterized protein n=1 Tax=Apodospora peruviana TaxID=516989 RepID=A0AAE0M2H6_9PEZI|nr:hypothetical protein B0H66DRAFT_594103 [Apodospora peruviana]
MADSQDEKLILRDETIIPAVCYDVCNDAYIEAQRENSTTLCASGSPFQSLYQNCDQCVASNGQKVYEDPRFAQFVDDCATAPTELTTTIASTSYYTTVTRSQWVEITALDGVVTSQFLTLTIPLDAVTTIQTVWAMPNTTTSSSTTMLNATMSTSPIPTTTPAASSTPSTPTIVGITVGTVIGVAIMLFGLAYYIRRQKSRGSRDEPSSGLGMQEKAQLHGDSMKFPETLPQELHGSTLVPPAELGAGDLSRHYAELAADEPGKRNKPGSIGAGIEEQT